ncbi:MAG: ABC transporter substrate-binding protein [Nitrospirae bacterium]|nr:ABC transporter substrate-binding protein [Nitrospirota bacterium]
MKVLKVFGLYFLVFSAFLCSAVFAADQNIPSIKVGHVGHDHQLALYVAAEAGAGLEKEYGVYLKELKPQEVYDLYDGGHLAARVHLVRVGGGSKMPAALEQGHIEVGLGGLGPVVKFIDKGAQIRVLAPLNNDGDSLILRNGFPAHSWQEFVREVKASPKPVRIGYKDPMANAYMILTRALSEEGIRYGQEPVGQDGRPMQVITVNLQGDENALPSLESGLVDGVVVNEPTPSMLVHKKAGHKAADLSDLPPKGKWKGHPCCVVAATETALHQKPRILRSLLKVIAAGADLMSRDVEKAIAAEAKWTKTAPDIGRKSIINVSYVIRPDEAWQKAVDTWVDLMITSNQFQKNLKGKTSSEIHAVILELTPMNEALSELRLKPGKVKKN